VRCLSCRRWSLLPVCSLCEKEFFAPEFHERKVGSLEVLSLFGYRSIEPYLLSKHTALGYRIFRYFGRRHIAPFLKRIAAEIPGLTLIPLDDLPRRGGYSHTALLTRYAPAGLRVLTGALRAGNAVSYAGKSLEYRLAHPREFRYRGPGGIEAVLVDDVVTTGTTLSEAAEVLRAHEVEVLFALTLADARY